MDAVERYIQALAEPDKSALQHVSDLIRQTAPNAEVKIYYGVPSFLINGKLLLGIAAGKTHLSLYPTGAGVDAVKHDLKNYSLSKGTIRFTAEKPVPDHVLIKLLSARLSQIS